MFQFLYFSMAWSGYRLRSSLTPSTILLFIPFFKSISISIFISLYVSHSLSLSLYLPTYLSIYLSIFISVGWNGFQCPHYNFDAACPMLSCHLISCQVPWWSPTILHRSIWPSSYLSLLLPFLVWVSLLEPLLFRISLEDDVITLHNPRQHPTPPLPTHICIDLHSLIKHVLTDSFSQLNEWIQRIIPSMWFFLPYIYFHFILFYFILFYFITIDFLSKTIGIVPELVPVPVLFSIYLSMPKIEINSVFQSTRLENEIN